jgi:hypothetical protein
MSDSTGSASNVGAILDAYLRALEKGEAPPREELLKQHPACAAELSAALDGLEFIHRATREMPRTLKEGDLPPARELLGDFKLVRELGRGGMAVVYEAEQVSLGRRVALKVLPFAAVLDPKQLQRFKNEALSAAHLHHPHIVPVYAVGCERGVHYYAMQLVEGQSLAAAIRDMKGQAPAGEPRTPISSHGSNQDPAYVRMAASLGVQAAEALDHAHQLGIVHRDVKPGNLLVDHLGELWITDFGLAHSVRDGDLTITGELLGTFRYMSPEQTRAKRTPMDHRTDVYSLGATLYEVLTLEPAFPGDDPHVVMRDIAEKDPIAPRRLNPALPVDLETILLKAMAKDPSSRYATAQEMAEDLARYLDDQPILARRPSLAARSSKWARRHRGFVAAAAVVLLLGVVSLVADIVRVGHEQRNTKAALDQANSNLRLARSAVDKFLVEIGVADMADQPVPRPKRKHLLETALHFYEREFADRDSVGTRVTILHALHRFDDAIRLLDGQLAVDPSYSWALMQRGHMLWHLKRNEEAVATLRQAIEAESGLAEAHSFLGCVLAETGRLQEALAEHDQAIELSPEVAPYRNYRGNVLLDLGRPQDALVEFDRAISLDPNLPNPHSGKASALSGLGRLEDALAEYDRSIIVDPGYAWGYTGRGMTLAALGRLDDALRAHNTAIELDPDSARAHVNRGLVLKELGRIDDAVADYQEAIRLEPTLIEAHEDLTVARIEAGRFDEAETSARIAVERAPRNSHALFNFGCVFTARKDWTKAIEIYQGALELEPDLVPALVNLGAALANSGRLLDSFTPYRRAVELAPGDADAWGGLGNALRDDEQYEKALEAYSKVVEIKPGYARGHYCKGTMLARTGKPREAIAEYREALKCDEQCAEAHYAIGDVLRDQRDPDGALEAYDDALAVRPEYAEAWRAKGKAYAEKGDLNGEIKAYEEAVKLRANYAEAWTELGRARSDRGTFDGAIEACKRALEIDPALPEAHLNLGIAFCGRKELDRGLEQFHEVIRLLSDRVPDDAKARSDYQRHDALTLALAYNSLGCTLADKKELEPALAAYRESIRIDSEVAPAHYNLAWHLFGSGKDDAEAEKEFKEAIRLEPGMPEAQCGLGRLYMAQGKNRDALPHLRQGHELGMRRGNWTVKSADWIATAERRVALEDRLESVVSGAAQPRDERERAELAILLYSRQRYLEAERFLEKALENEPKLADDLVAAVRYNAACTAVLAAASGAPDGAALRARALSWLRADLEARAQAGDLKRLADWKKDGDFKSVRDDVAALPEAERDGWTKLWADVDERIAPKLRPK